jgi:hypothetical protein
LHADRLRLVSGFDQIKWDTATVAGGLSPHCAAHFAFPFRVLRCFTGNSHLLGPANPHTYSHASTSTSKRSLLSLTHIPPIHTTNEQTRMRFHTQPLYAQTMRYYAQSTRAAKSDRLGAAVTAGYCCLVLAPFAGAALVSKNAKKDGRYAKLYVSYIPAFNLSQCSPANMDTVAVR